MENSPVFTIKTAVFYTILIFLVQVLTGVAAVFLFGVIYALLHPGLDPGKISGVIGSSNLLFVAIFITAEMMILFVGIRIKNKYRNTIRDLFVVHELNPVFLALIAGFCLAYIFPSSELENLCASLVGRNASFAETLTKIARMPGAGGLVVGILVVAVLPAIVEELVFRGLIQKNLAANYGNRRALLATSFLFMIVHVNPTALISIFILALMLGFVYVRTGKLAYSVVMHFCYNLISLLMLRYNSFELKGLNTSLATVEHVSPAIVLPAALLAVLLAWQIARYKDVRQYGGTGVGNVAS